MDNYLLIKLIHIIAAVIVAGTGTGIAFFMLMAYRSKNPQAIYITAKNVVLADWIFTAPAVIAQFISGMLLMEILGYSMSSQWFYWVFSLFLLIGLCWLPVIVIQYKLRNLADDFQGQTKVPDSFTKLMRLWTLLGIPAFISILVLFWLMVFKPFPVQ